MNKSSTNRQAERPAKRRRDIETDIETPARKTPSLPRTKPNGKAELSAKDNALANAKEGIRSIWIPRGKKAPIETAWPEVATTKAATIKRWEKEHPGCNFGLVMGHGFIAIDFDTQQAILDHKAEFPETRAHTTPGGGLHLIYKVPKNAAIRNKTRIFPGVDIRAQGGQIVCPGSVHPNGGIYGIFSSAPIAPLSKALLTKLTETTRTQPTATTPNDVPEGQRNDTLFRLGAKLRRAGLEQDEIEAALLERNSKFSSPLSDRDVQRIAASDARYEVPAAISYLECKEMMEINAEAALIREPLMVAIFPHTSKNTSGHFMLKNEKDFAMIYGNLIRRVTDEKGNTHERSAAKDWLNWPNRAEYQALCYEPGNGAVVGEELNIWEPFPSEPKKGNVKPVIELFNVLMRNASPEHKKWLWQWFAYPIQHPGAKLHTAVLMWGEDEGTGKTLLGLTIAQVYGSNAMKINQTNLEDGFNSWAMSKQFIVGEEITGGAGRKTADRLKDLVTGKTVNLRRMYIDPFEIKNYINFYMTSNHPDALYVTDRDRRYFVHEVDEHDLTPEFFITYGKWLEKPESIAALYWHLLHGVDTSGFNPYAKAPRTASHAEMVEANENEYTTWCRELKAYPDNVLRAGDVIVPHSLFTAKELLAFYSPATDPRRYATQRGLELALKHAKIYRPCKGQPVDIGNGKRRRVYQVRGDTPLAGSQKAIGERYVQEREPKEQEPKPPNPRKQRGKRPKWA